MCPPPLFVSDGVGRVAGPLGLPSAYRCQGMAHLAGLSVPRNTRGQYFLGDCTEIKMLCVCMCVCTQMEKMIE